MSEIEPTDRGHAGQGTLEERDAYEPPRIVVLGTVVELTSGGGAGGGDAGCVSSALAAQGREGSAKRVG
jgi:hypothetical protein